MVREDSRLFFLKTLRLKFFTCLVRTLGLEIKIHNLLLVFQLIS